MASRKVLPRSSYTLEYASLSVLVNRVLCNLAVLGVVGL